MNKSYHHGDLRQSLIECACEQLREDSADHLSLRALARRTGVSQTAPYRHFETKNALFAAIATYGFELLTDHLCQACSPPDHDIEETIVALGMAYVEWAVANPEKYQLFFDSSLVDFGAHDDLHEAGSACFDVLLEHVTRGIETGLLLDRPPVELAGTLWASVHGLASLLMSKDPEMLTKRPDAPAVQAISALVENRESVVRMFVNSIKTPC